MSLRVAAVQLPGSRAESAWDLAPIEAGLEQAAAAGAELVVLPELSTTPYFCFRAGVAAEYAPWARAVDAPEIAKIAVRSERLGLIVVLPFFEVDAGGRHNAAVVLDRGRIAVGRDAAGNAHAVDEKVHLPVGTEPPPGFDESAHFAPGSSLNVHDLEGFNLGLLICYDRRFPESWRMMRSLGADVVAVPVAGAGTDPVGFFVAELRTHARENGVFVVAASKVGDDNVAGQAVPNLGESCIVSPEGVVVGYRSAAQGPGVIVADLDLDELRRTRRDIGLFDERRLDVIGEWRQTQAARGHSKPASERKTSGSANQGMVGM